MHADRTRFSRWFLVAVLLAAAACQGDHLTGPPQPSLATAAATWHYVWFTAGFHHSCVSRAPVGSSNRTLLCWGSNASGQLGVGSSGGNRLTPTAVPNNTGSFFAL